MVVVSQDGFNLTENWRSIIVVPISISTRQSGRGPTTVPHPAGTGGLSQHSTAVCHQVTTLDRAKFDGRIGTLPPEHLQAVDQALKAAMNLI